MLKTKTLNKVSILLLFTIPPIIEYSLLESFRGFSILAILIVAGTGYLLKENLAFKKVILLSKPKEIREIFDEIETLKSLIFDADSKSLDDFGVESKVKSLELKAKETILNNSKRLTKKVKEGQNSPFEIASNIMLNECRAQITSGENHLHRGILSSDGKIYQEVIDLILSELEKRNLLSREEKNSIKEDLQSEIQDAG